MRRGGTEQVLLWTLSHLGAQERLGCVLAAPQKVDAICMQEGASPVPGLSNMSSQCLTLIICSSV